MVNRYRLYYMNHGQLHVCVMKFIKQWKLFNCSCNSPSCNIWQFLNLLFVGLLLSMSYRILASLGAVANEAFSNNVFPYKEKTVTFMCKTEGHLLKCHLEVSSHFFWALRVWLPVIYFSFSTFRVRVSRKYRSHLGRERVYSRRKGNESIIQGLFQCSLFLDSLIQKKKKKTKAKEEKTFTSMRNENRRIIQGLILLKKNQRHKKLVTKLSMKEQVTKEPSWLYFLRRILI